jgi:hypothetical protein
MTDRFDNVSEEIYRGGAPSENDLDLLSNVFNIKTILSLDGNIASGIAPKVKELGMEHIVIPISGIGSFSLMKYLQNNVVSILKSKQPIYVHCRHGSDRTGMAIALYRMDHDGWSAEEAMEEARSFGFGDKLDDNTEKLYGNIIMRRAQSAVDSARDHFDMGRVPPAFSPMQSFAPEEDVKFWEPIEPIEDAPPAFRDPFAFNLKLQHPVSEKEKRKRKLRAIVLEELLSNTAPQIGQYDNFDGIRGAGPLAGDDENTGGFSYDEGGGLLGGVGPSGTGGFINL